ncbi:MULTISPECIES: class I SAM-dependent methyltransferase [unclassified Paenibacillus]|uniref:class I SAM-dependent methyltransferase n=1 Tax=unclassified Paenibacillus TaxID=185978 RepID=UPI00070951EF|nr:MULTISPECIES: class I SAM-dependent methyltransferase [unclassified Paenibacillus]KQX69046.1 methyltransferase [Paenibacillus sp. Root444D2]KRE51592.1 methyltransferase [Paenibacillus sp. Soil724D2]
MDNRIKIIRDEERKYHEACYDNYKLFEEGSWLSKPVKTVMDTLTHFKSKENLTVLDLGCGVGRNSIPIAESLKEHQSGKIICVDIMESALKKLVDYSEQNGVRAYIEPKLSDIGDYIIEENQFDYIIAVSALEHVESVPKFVQVVDRMARGTKENGINCVIMSTNIQEIDVESGMELDPFMELNLTTSDVKQLISSAYSDWEVIFTTLKALQFNIERNGREILLKSDCLTYVIQRNKENKS